VATNVVTAGLTGLVVTASSVRLRQGVATAAGFASGLPPVLDTALVVIVVVLSVNDDASVVLVVSLGGCRLAGD